MILTSFAFFAGGSFVLQQALDAKSRAERQKIATHEQCVSFLETLPSAQVSTTGKGVTVILSDANDPRRAIADASIAALMCPGKSVVSACLGDKCLGSDDRLIMRFTLEDNG